MKGELIIEAQWRIPSDRLEPADIDAAVVSFQKSLLEVKLKSHSISGYAVTEEQPDRSTGYQFIVGPKPED